MYRNEFNISMAMDSDTFDNLQQYIIRQNVQVSISPQRHRKNDGRVPIVPPHYQEDDENGFSSSETEHDNDDRHHQDIVARRLQKWRRNRCQMVSLKYVLSAEANDGNSGTSIQDTTNNSQSEPNEQVGRVERNDDERRLVGRLSRHQRRCRNFATQSRATEK